MDVINILAVDDDPTTLVLLKGILKAAGYGVLTAANGVEALGVLRQGGIDLILTDINMPEMDGLMLLGLVREHHPFMPVVVLTSRDDRETVRRALQLGADDYLDKPVNAAALLGSLRTAMSSPMRTQLKQSVAARDGLQQAQRELMMSTHLGNLRQAGLVDFWYRPRAEAGGDFIFARPLAPDDYLLVLVDAAGHDILSSYDIAEFKGFLSVMAQDAVQPEEILARLNEHIIGLQKHRHCCALALRWNTATGRIMLANAGLPHGRLLCANGWRLPLRLNGACLGLLPDTPAAFDSLALTLSPGDRMLLHTDGLEAASAPEALAAAWLALRPEPLAGAAAVLAQRLALDQQSTVPDDVLMLVLEQPALAPPPAAHLAGPPLVLNINIPSHRGMIESAMRQITELMQDCAVATAERRAEYALAVREIINNALIHGNQEDERLMASITINIQPAAARMTVAVCDQGPGFSLPQELEQEKNDAPLRQGRRGLIAAAHYSDKIEISGNCVILLFAWQTPAGDGGMHACKE